jgi:hypothetical protein
MQARKVSAELEKQLEALRHTLQSAKVRLEHPEEIYASLCQHPDLTPVVAHAVKQARDAFPDATLLLQLYHDPEIEEDTLLVLLIRSETYPPDFWQRLTQLRSQEIEPLCGHCDRFHLTTDFGQP